jgi:hypothetical protein
MNAANTGATYDIDIVNSADSEFATTMIPKYVYVRMFVFTTDGKWNQSPNSIVKLVFRCATASTTVNIPTVL